MADSKKTKPKAKPAAKRATTRKTGGAATRSKPKAKSQAGTTRKAKPAKSAATSKRPEKSAGRTASNAGAGADRRQNSRRTFTSRPARKSFGTAGTGPEDASAASVASRVDSLGESVDIRNLVNKLWRLVAMIAFGFLGFWVYLALAILAAVQFFVVLFSDSPSRQIGRFMDLAAAYIAQVMRLLSYHSEDLPYPLGPPPEIDQ